MEAKTYEFTNEQNMTLRNLSKRMKAVGVFLLIGGGLTILSGVQEMMFGGNIVFSAATGTIYILMGIWTFKAGNSFAQVVQTEGNDVAHLMKANSSLLNLYNLQFWLFIIALVLIVLAIFLAGGKSEGVGTQS